MWRPRRWRFEIFGIAEGTLRTQAPAFFEVLLQIKVLVLDVQAGDVLPLGSRGCEKRAGRGLRHPAVEDQLQAIRPAQVQIVAHHLFEEFAPSLRAVKDLSQAHFHLPDRQLPVVAGFTIRGAQRRR